MPETAPKIEMLTIDALVFDAEKNPREDYDSPKMQEYIHRLAASYATTQGTMMEPIEVDEHNVVRQGGCRARAAQRAGLTRIPTRRLTGLSEQDWLLRQLISDALRKDLDPIERGWAYLQAIIQIEGGQTVLRKTVKQMVKQKPQLLERVPGGDGGVSKLAQKLSVEASTIGYYLDILRLAPETQKLIQEGRLPRQTGYYVSRIQEPRIREKFERTITTAAKTERVPQKELVGRARAITDTEKQAPKVAEAVAEAKIAPEEAKQIAKAPKETQRQLIDNVMIRRRDLEREVEAAKSLKEPVAPPVIPEAWRREVQQRAAEQNAWMQQHLQDPLVREKRLLAQSWLSLENVVEYLDKIVCPECGRNGAAVLRFHCHPDMTLQEAIDRTTKKMGLKPGQERKP